MMKALFGELREGRITRMNYVVYLILLMLILILLTVFVFALFVICVAIAVGVIEQALGGDAQQARTPLIVGMMLIYIPILIAMMFAGHNLQAKRWRDIGLPGWTTVAVMVLIGALLRLVGWEQIDFGLSALVLLALLLIPTDALAGRGAKT